MATERHVNEKVSIVILPSAERLTYAAEDRGRIASAVSEKLLLATTEPYHKVQVAVHHAADGSPQSATAFMLRKYTYTADVATLELANDYSVRSIAVHPAGLGHKEEYTYASASAKPAERPSKGTSHPGGKGAPDMVFGTPVPEIASALAGVNYACSVARKAGYKVVKLLGPDASRANYSAYLSGHLKAFGNIGHGYTGGIVLSDGNLDAGWFSGLGGDGLRPEVIYFNSCDTFNPPLQPAIAGAGARTFIGGKIKLLIGPSENVFKCFWAKILAKAANAAPMRAALSGCEATQYPVRNAHGFWGFAGKF